MKTNTVSQAKIDLIRKIINARLSEKELQAVIKKSQIYFLNEYRLKFNN